jgi:hypothetical protein
VSCAACMLCTRATSCRTLLTSDCPHGCISREFAAFLWRELAERSLLSCQVRIFALGQGVRDNPLGVWLEVAGSRRLASWE